MQVKPEENGENTVNDSTLNLVQHWLVAYRLSSKSPAKPTARGVEGGLARR